MDISKIAVAERAPIHLKGPDGELLFDNGKPVRIHIYGPGSAKFAEIEQLQNERLVTRMRENEGKLPPIPVDQANRERAEDLAELTIQFENLSAGELQGKELFQAVYLNRAVGFIAQQMQVAVGKWGNFKESSPTA